MCGLACIPFTEVHLPSLLVAFIYPVYAMSSLFARQKLVQGASGSPHVMSY